MQSRDLQAFDGLSVIAVSGGNEPDDGELLDSVLETMRERNCSFAAACKRRTADIAKVDAAIVRAAEREERKRLARIEKARAAKDAAERELAALTGE